MLPTAPPQPAALPQASASSLSRPGREEALHKRQKGLQGENIKMKHSELPLSVGLPPHCQPGVSLLSAVGVTGSDQLPFISTLSEAVGG